MAKNLLFPFNIPVEEIDNAGIIIKFRDETHRLTYKVNSFLQLDILLTLLFKFQKKDEDFKAYHSYFRGVSSVDYKIKCGLQRHNFEIYESDLIDEFYNKSPSEFNSCKSDFEMMSKMQHYGLPTRFVDFTTNPLVAAWFACQPQNDANFSSDGLIYMALNNIKMDKDLINIICKLALKSNRIGFPGKFYHVLDHHERKYYLESISNGFFSPFITPPYISKRQINQQSVFGVCVNGLMWLNHKTENHCDVTLHNWMEALLVLNRDFDATEFISLRNDLKDFQSVVSGTQYIKIEIAEEAKEEILEELAFRGVTREFIYPELNNVAEKIISNTKYKKDFYDEFIERTNT